MAYDADLWTLRVVSCGYGWPKAVAESLQIPFELRDRVARIIAGVSELSMLTSEDIADEIIGEVLKAFDCQERQTSKTSPPSSA